MKQNIINFLYCYISPFKIKKIHPYDESIYWTFRNILDLGFLPYFTSLQAFTHFPRKWRYAICKFRNIYILTVQGDKMNIRFLINNGQSNQAFKCSKVDRCQGLAWFGVRNDYLSQLLVNVLPDTGYYIQPRFQISER